MIKDPRMIEDKKPAEELKNKREKWKSLSLADMGKRMQMLMKEKGYKQKDISALMNVSPQTVNAWVQGKTAISLDAMVPLCEILDCDMDYLAGRIERTNHKRQDICNLTGFSEKAARELQIRHPLISDGSFLRIDQTDLINFFLASGKARSVCKLLQSALYAGVISSERAPTPFIESDLSDARNLAEPHGAVVMDSDIAIEYYFRIASDLFRDMLPELIGSVSSGPA